MKLESSPPPVLLIAYKRAEQKHTAYGTTAQQKQHVSNDTWRRENPQQRSRMPQDSHSRKETQKNDETGVITAPIIPPGMVDIYPLSPIGTHRGLQSFSIFFLVTAVSGLVPGEGAVLSLQANGAGHVVVPPSCVLAVVEL